MKKKLWKYFKWPGNGGKSIYRYTDIKNNTYIDLQHYENNKWTKTNHIKLENLDTSITKLEMFELLE